MTRVLTPLPGLGLVQASASEPGLYVALREDFTFLHDEDGAMRYFATAKEAVQALRDAPPPPVRKPAPRGPAECEETVS